MSVHADRSSFRLLVVVAAGLLGTAVIAIGLTIWWLRADAIDDASRDTSNLAIVLAEQTNRAVQSIDLVLNEIQERIESLGARTENNFRRLLQDEDTYQLLTDRLSHLSHATLIGVVDKNGWLVTSTQKWPSPAIDFSDREHFQYFRNNNDEGIYIAKPVADRIKGDQVIFFSKRINDANNAFLGIIVVGIKLSYFQQIYNSITSLPGQSFMLMRNDGTVILLYPDPKDRAGEKMPAGSPLYRLVSQGGGTYRSPGYYTGIARLIAVRPLSDYPLVINVAASETAALANWRNHAIFIGVGTLLALICTAFLLKILNNKFHDLIESKGALAKNTHELVLANVTIDAALNNILQGLVMFDSSARLVVCNRVYLKMYGLSPDIVRPGCTLRELLRHRAEIGSAVSDDPEQYISELLAAIGQGKIFNKITALAGGRIVSVANHPMVDGGWVATHEDITEEKRAEERIVHAAHHDALTGLPNRILFAEQLEQALKRVRRGERLAVLYIDLDRLKRVNDTLGHPIGDKLLKGVAYRLRGCIRDIDTAARLSGDDSPLFNRRLIGLPTLRRSP